MGLEGCIGVCLWEVNKILSSFLHSNVKKGLLLGARSHQDFEKPACSAPSLLLIDPLSSCDEALYPIPTGSPEEREAFTRANHLNKLVNKEETGVAMRIRVGEGMNRGCDFDVFAHITNSTPEEHTGRLLLCARTVSYNGILGPECGTKDLLSLSLEPYSGKVLCPWSSC